VRCDSQAHNTAGRDGGWFPKSYFSRDTTEMVDFRECQALEMIVK
jgi:hypothetical protein